METWQTPDDLWNKLHEKYKFDLDPCAPRGYDRPVKFYTMDHDGLSKPWAGSVFCNPPWSQIMSWLDKGHHEMFMGRPTHIVWLLPCRTGTKWWQTFHEVGRIEWLPGRLTFKDAPNNCMEYCCLWIWQ